MVWDAQSRRRLLLLRWQNEQKSRARPLIRRGRQTSPVSLNDRATDREPHSHPAGLRGEEGIEQPVCILGGNADAAIGDTNAHATRFVQLRSDHKLASPVRNWLHGF